MEDARLQARGRNNVGIAVALVFVAVDPAHHAHGLGHGDVLQFQAELAGHFRVHHDVVRRIADEAAEEGPGGDVVDLKIETHLVGRLVGHVQ